VSSLANLFLWKSTKKRDVQDSVRAALLLASTSGDRTAWCASCVWSGGAECEAEEVVGDGDAEMQAPTARQIHEDGGDDVATDRPKTLWRPDKTLLPSRGRETKPR
jgi:hypothetical protein